MRSGGRSSAGRCDVLILGIETATLQAGCAVGGHEGVLAAFQSARGRRHAEVLAPAIEFTCKQARIDLKEIGAIAVDIGPGLFTGLRVGVATAKAMAQGLRVPMFGVSSLDLLAFPVRHTSKLIVAAIDARRSELVHARALREEFVPTWELEPLYLRKADAEINWERRDAFPESA